jgi:uncharacterized protein YdiU (UPF0061 family)
MDSYHPETVYSSIDHQGRYAYRNQPGIAQWNLACLAQTLLPLIDEDPDRAREMAQESLDEYPKLYQGAYRQGMASKLGLSTLAPEDDGIAIDLLELMAKEQADFTLAFRRLADLAQADHGPGVNDLFDFPPSFAGWLERWRQHVDQDSGDLKERQVEMNRANPAFIPRNHLVAEAIDSAVNNEDFGPFNTLVDLLEKQRDYDPDLARFATPPRPEQVVSKTFCGT